jgi:hypothetical protein
MEGAAVESVLGADQTFSELRESYFKACSGKGHTSVGG